MLFRSLDFESTPAEIAQNTSEKDISRWLYVKAAAVPKTVAALTPTPTAKKVETEIKAAKKILDLIADGKIRVKAPYVDILKDIPTLTHKNKRDISNTVDFIYDDRIRNAKTQEEFKNAYNSILEEQIKVKGQLARSKYLDSQQRQEYAAELANLKALNFDDFNFTPVLIPPKKPTGAMARVFSTRPDAEYYVLDLPLEIGRAHV